MDATITAKIIWRNICIPEELEETSETLEQMVRRLAADDGFDTGDEPVEILSVEAL